MTKVEWPTLVVLVLCYALWAGATTLVATFSLSLAVVLTGLAITLHSSLQHEALHGHPTPWTIVNEALVFPALGLLVPYGRFRDLHLEHHRDAHLTDPYDDPESCYLDPKVWAQLPPLARRILTFNNTLLGRMLIGPLISQWSFMRGDLARHVAGDGAPLRAWALHVLALLPVGLWLGTLGTMPLWSYLLALYLGHAILRIRTFLEHQAHQRANGRTVIIEDRGLLAFLFLNNNFHAVHHAVPQLPWYRLPARYRAHRETYLARNRGYLYRSYGTIIRQYLLRTKEPVAHPIYDRPR